MNNLHCPFPALRMSSVVALIAVASLATASQLAPGSKAPKIEVKEWIKGNPIREFSPDGVYVVEFWATWCGPCIQAMPHLTELAKKYPATRFLGIGVYEINDDKRVQKFVAEKGDIMGYTVGYSGDKGGMAQSWLAAAKERGIPSTFIVSKGVIQWIGHPLQLEEPLKAVLDGTLNTQTERASFLQTQADRKNKNRAILESYRIEDLYDSGKVKEAKAALEKFAKWPGSAEHVDEIRFYWEGLENPTQEWKEEMKIRLRDSNVSVERMAYLSLQLVTTNPRVALWIHRRVQEHMDGKSDWFVDRTAADVLFAVKKYEEALKFAQRAHADFIGSNPQTIGTDSEKPYLERIRKIEGAIAHSRSDEKSASPNPSGSLQMEHTTV